MGKFAKPQKLGWKLGWKVKMTVTGVQRGIYQGRTSFWEYGHSKKHLSMSCKSRAPPGKVFMFFLQDTLKTIF